MIPQTKRDSYLRAKIRAEAIKDCSDRLMQHVGDIPTRTKIIEELSKMFDSEMAFMNIVAREIADTIIGS